MCTTHTTLQESYICIFHQAGVALRLYQRQPTSLLMMTHDNGQLENQDVRGELSLKSLKDRLRIEICAKDPKFVLSDNDREEHTSLCCSLAYVLKSSPEFIKTKLTEGIVAPCITSNANSGGKRTRKEDHQVLKNLLIRCHEQFGLNVQVLTDNGERLVSSHIQKKIKKIEGYYMFASCMFVPTNFLFVPI